MKKRIMSILLSLAMVLSYLPVHADDAEAITITYSNKSVTSSKRGAVVIDGTTVSITKPGTYILTGSCSNGNLTVAKNSGNVNLILDNLNLVEINDGECPIYTKGGSTVVNIEVAKGTVNYLTDTNTKDTKSLACIQALGDLNITGTGKLILTTNQSGIQCSTNLSMDSLDLEVNAKKNGIDADESVYIESGTYTITTELGAGIQSNPAVLYDNGLNGNIHIIDGTFTIESGSEGIRGLHECIIEDGNYMITAHSGSNGILEENETASGIYAGSSMIIYNGEYLIDSADDGLHSDDYLMLSEGNYTIYSGDDGIHANSTVIIGKNEGEDSNLVMNIPIAYQGIEAGNVYLYSGEIALITEDDGINACGDSNRNDEFKLNGIYIPGLGGNSSEVSEYGIRIYGGKITIDASGDGLDTKGSILFDGGDTTIYSSESEIDSPLDYGHECIIQSGTILAGGNKEITITQANQNYGSLTNVALQKGEAINLLGENGKVLASTLAPKKINTLFYSANTLPTNAVLLSTTRNELLEIGSLEVINFELDVTNMTLMEGEKSTIIASTISEILADSIIWSSSNEEVATVNQGVVSAIQEGKTIISATCGKVTREVEVEVIYNNPFEDVQSGKWYYNVVKEVNALGLMTGTSSTTFAPTNNMTRGMVATVLYRMANSPEVEYQAYFPDVLGNKYYSKAVTWCYENKIVSGNADGTFTPYNNITRQELAIMLRNYAARIGGIDIHIETSIDGFVDASTVSKWAVEAVGWCVSTNIITGKVKAEGTYLDPKSYATRAECAKMLLSTYKLIQK